MESSPSIEPLLERSEGLRPLREMVIAPEKSVFWDTKNRLRAFQRQKTAEATDKANSMQPSAFFLFLPFLCGITDGPPVSPASGTNAMSLAEC
jgi:hypothetical protein